MEEKQTELVQAVLTPSEFQRLERARSLTRILSGGLELKPMRKCPFVRELLLLGLTAFEQRTSSRKKKGVRE